MYFAVYVQLRLRARKHLPNTHFSIQALCHSEGFSPKNLAAKQHNRSKDPSLR